MYRIYIPPKLVFHPNPDSQTCNENTGRKSRERTVANRLRDLLRCETKLQYHARSLSMSPPKKPPQIPTASTAAPFRTPQRTIRSFRDDYHAQAYFSISGGLARLTWLPRCPGICRVGPGFLDPYSRSSERGNVPEKFNCSVEMDAKIKFTIITTSASEPNFENKSSIFERQRREWFAFLYVSVQPSEFVFPNTIPWYLPFLHACFSSNTTLYTMPILFNRRIRTFGVPSRARNGSAQMIFVMLIRSLPLFLS
jgi:hypothetical protein